jgi:hypothetical protein
MHNSHAMETCSTHSCVCDRFLHHHTFPSHSTLNNTSSRYPLFLGVRNTICIEYLQYGAAHDIRYNNDGCRNLIRADNPPLRRQDKLSVYAEDQPWVVDPHTAHRWAHLQLTRLQPFSLLKSKQVGIVVLFSPRSLTDISRWRISTGGGIDDADLLQTCTVVSFFRELGPELFG